MKTQPLTNALKYIQGKGFTHIKLEIEGNLNRNDTDEYDYCDYCEEGVQECEHDTTCLNCNGEVTDENGTDCQECYGGTIDCQEGHQCYECDGSGRVSYGSNLDETYCGEYIRNRISAEAREAMTFSMFYDDSSVDSEFTVTIPVEKAHLLPEFIEAFKSLENESGHLDDNNAGLHISVLTSGNYPCEIRLNDDFVANFKQQVTKLLPALYFVASSSHKTRALNYRMPRISHREKYSAIYIQRGSIEYRLFEPCFQAPEMVLDYVQTIAKTLRYYSAQTIKQEFFKEFRFSNQGHGYLGRLFQTADQVEVLDKSLRYVLPNGKSPEQAKRERKFSANSEKMAKRARLEEAKLLIAYQDYLHQQQEEIWHWVRREYRQTVALNSIQRKLYPDAKPNPERVREVIAELKAKRVSDPATWEHWRNYKLDSEYRTLRLTT